MTTTESRSRKHVIAVMNAKRRKVTITVATASYRLASGKTSTVHLKLNPTGKALLARFRKLPVTVLVTQRVGKKTVRIASRRQTIVAPKRKH